MSKVAITTDSACIPPELASRFDITIIPYHVVISSKDYSDWETPREELYNRLKAKENLPTSSIPSIGEFLQTWQKLSQSAESILHIAMTKSFSGMYNVATEARQMAREALPKTSIEVIDSKSVASGQLLIALQAARAAAQGANLTEVATVASDATAQISYIEARDTLFYFDKAGRAHEAPETHSWAEAESKNSFRSILEVDASTGGIPKPVARAKTKKQIIEKMVDIAKKKTGDKKLYGAILHTQALEQAEQLRAMLTSKLQCEGIYIYEGSPVCVVNNGLGLVALGFYSN